MIDCIRGCLWSCGSNVQKPGLHLCPVTVTARRSQARSRILVSGGRGAGHGLRPRQKSALRPGLRGGGAPQRSFRGGGGSRKEEGGRYRRREGGRYRRRKEGDTGSAGSSHAAVEAAARRRNRDDQSDSQTRTWRLRCSRRAGKRGGRNPPDSPCRSGQRYVRPARR